MNDEWLIDTYERIVAAAGDDGITVKESRELVATAYEEAVRSGKITRAEIDLYDEGLTGFDKAVRPRLRARSSSLHRDMETITRAIGGETILGVDDPILYVAYPLGTDDGRDKVLALWTAEDWRSSAMTRYRGAAEVTAAAQIFDEQATLIARQITARNCITTGAIFVPPTADENRTA